MREPRAPIQAPHRVNISLQGIYGESWCEDQRIERGDWLLALRRQYGQFRPQFRGTSLVNSSTTRAASARDTSSCGPPVRSLGNLFEGHPECGIGPIVVVGQLIPLEQFCLDFRLTNAAANGHNYRLPLKSQHPSIEDGSFQVLELFLNELTLLNPAVFGPAPAWFELLPSGQSPAARG